MLTIPTLLTLSRLALLPVLIWLMFIPAPWAWWSALALYAVCAATDYLDGWVARKTNTVSDIGTFLDPISDKIFVAALLVVLVGLGRLPGLLMILPVIILIREFLVAGLREYLGPKNIKVPVAKLAKWKTAAQMLALGFLIIAPAAPALLLTGQWTLAIAALLTVVTGWGYVKTGLQHIAS